MAKKGFFSWFRKDKSQDEVVEQTPVVTPSQTEQDEALAEQQAEAARLAAEKIAAENAEAERIAAEQATKAQVEALRLAEAEEQAIKAQAAAERFVEQQAAETARLAAEQALAAQLAAEKAESERIATEQAAKAQAEVEALRLAEEQAEVARLAEQQAAEATRLAAEQALAEQLAAEKAEAEQIQVEQPLEQQPEPQAKPAKESFFARLKRGLMRTSENIGSGFIGLFRGKKIDDELFEELEEQLLIADVGVETTGRLIKSLTEHASRKQLKDAEALYDLLRDEMQKTLDPVAIPLVPENANGPFVILMVGVNGVGKTTKIGRAHV